MKKIECVIFDWAGTVVDYGCFAPVSAFVESFGNIGINITAKEARGPMGLNKIDHIRALFSLDRVSADFERKYGRRFNEDDVKSRYEDFRKSLFSTLSKYTDPVPGVIETVEQLRMMGIRIGSTTGYTADMMDVVLPAAASKGYSPDNCVTADHLPAGRPFPYMIYRNMCDLAVPSVSSVMKVGDTISDIKEGVNAGVWSVGVILGSNELGLDEMEVNVLDKTLLTSKMNEVRMRMYAAGADYVIDSIHQLPALVEAVNARMNMK